MDQLPETQGKRFHLGSGMRKTAAADMQAISSVTGIEMDSWTLMKPMNWVPAGPTNMSAKISAFNTIYNPNGNVGEIFGLPGPPSHPSLRLSWPKMHQSSASWSATAA